MVIILGMLVFFLIFAVIGYFLHTAFDILNEDQDKL